MVTPNLSAIELVRQDFPDALLTDLARLISTLYRDTLDSARAEFQEPEALCAWRINRRCKIEGAARSVATLRGIKARAESNRSGDYHTVLETEHILLTISHVDSFAEVPRSAQFRQEHAIFNEPLFKQLEAPDSIEGKKYNALLIYGPNPRDSFRLGFVMIRFPSPAGTSWLDDLLNLMDRCDSISTEEPYKVEDVPAPEEPQIRTDQDKREEI